MEKRDLAVRAAAHFNTFIIENALSEGADQQLSEIVLHGLRLGGALPQVQETIHKIANGRPDGSVNFETRAMEAAYPDECLELADTFAQALLTGAGSEADFFRERLISNKDAEVSAALVENNAPLLASLFRPPHLH